MELSVIIVNYNVKHFLEQCLCSVSKAIRGIDAEIIVIDNNSVDNSIAYLGPEISRCSVYEEQRKPWIWQSLQPGAVTGIGEIYPVPEPGYDRSGRLLPEMHLFF
jgi:GT2 family glycosyltransferase